MRYLLYFLLTCLAFPCFAQKFPVGALTGKTALEQALKQTSNQGLRVLQGKIMPAGVDVALRRNSFALRRQDLEQNVLTSFPVPNIETMKLGIASPTDKQRKLIFDKYTQVTEKLRLFKEEMDGILYYQSNPSEKRTFAPQEKQYFLEQINTLNRELNALSLSVEKTDVVLQRGKAYLQYALSVVSPEMVGFLPNLQPTDPRTDRELKTEEFFLHDPAENRFAMWRLFQKLDSSSAIPNGLRIAVLNDRQAFLIEVEYAHKRKELFPLENVKTYEEVDILLEDIRSGRETFDVILSDLCVPDGGGFRLVQSLRQDGYKGVILAASAFWEEEVIAFSLYNRGFDGMFAIPENFETQPHWYDRLNQGLRNYFYYRNIHGWMR